MKLSDYIQKAFIKPLISGSLCAFASHFALNEPLQKAMVFGGSAGMGIFGFSLVSESIAAFLPTQTGVAGLAVSLEMRVIEVVLGSASVWAVDKYVTKNNIILGYPDMMTRVAIIAASDIAAESIIMMV